MKTNKKKSIWQRPTRFYPEGESLTKQAFQDECDIDKIISRFTKTGNESILQGSPLSEKNYGDFSDVPDLVGLYERINRAEESFMTLPANLRRKFENDPLQFMEFASDPSNVDEMRELGLATGVVSQEATPAVEPSEAKAE
jgi:hypothetical protein